MNIKRVVPYIPKVIAAVILLQTLAFKFTGHPQSVELFTQLGLFGMDESVGRIGVGIAELLVSIGLFVPRLSRFAGLGVIGMMAGALYFHATVLGFAGENLTLAVMAVVALVCGLIVVFRK